MTIFLAMLAVPFIAGVIGAMVGAIGKVSSMVFRGVMRAVFRFFNKGWANQGKILLALLAFIIVMSSFSASNLGLFASEIAQAAGEQAATGEALRETMSREIALGVEGAHLVAAALGGAIAWLLHRGCAWVARLVSAPRWRV